MRDCVLTEEGGATFGYNANCAGVGGGHVRARSNIDGNCTVNGPEVQHYLYSIYQILNFVEGHYKLFVGLFYPYYRRTYLHIQAYLNLLLQ